MARGREPFRAQPTLPLAEWVIGARCPTCFESDWSASIGSVEVDDSARMGSLDPGAGGCQLFGWAYRKKYTFLIRLVLVILDWLRVRASDGLRARMYIG